MQSEIDTKKKDPLYATRHSLAHVLAQAVLQVRPGTRLGFGPPTDNGFYYEFEIVGEPLVEADLKDIEKRMRKIVGQNQAFEREELSLDQMKADERIKDQALKVEYAAELLEKKDTGGSLSFYSNGPFTDMCEGPHVESTGKINAKAFKLSRMGGSYWRADESRPMLTRIYGLAFETPEALKEYEERMRLAEERDHRKLGKELDLFSMHDEGPGMAYWHPKGAMIREIMESFWKKEHRANGYDMVVSPHVGKSTLWETSGHLGFYAEGMFAPMEVDKSDYYIKPMNCPFHILIYKTHNRSYRELPLRYAELGTVYRYERSGTLHGLFRVRAFTQDDSHIFVTEEQLTDEIVRIVDLILFVLKTFGFEEFQIFVSTRPEKAIGDPAVWDKAEDGTRKRVVMLHRALFGSVERFFGILIEHYGGAFPLWLAPVQARVLTITNDQDAYAAQVLAKLRKADIRGELDLDSEKINAKVRRAQKEKIPFQLVVGAREAENGEVSVRRYGSRDSDTMSLDAFIEMAKKEAIIATMTDGNVA